MRATPRVKPRDASIEYGGREINVKVTFVASDRLSITVHPDLRVTATAPSTRPWEVIVARLKARAGWIVRQQREFSRYQPGPALRRYISGETHYYLGRQYRLKVRVAALPRVRIQGGYIHVDTADRQDRRRIREQVRMWYRHRAAEVLTHRFRLCFEKVRTLHIAETAPMLRCMRTRWGSCTKTGRVLLNPDLIKVPIACVDYVIVHELCHLKVLGHSVAFYRLLGRYMPDWERRRTNLNGFVFT